MKKCPFCAELIQTEAIKCRYCQSFLTDTPPPEAAAAARAATEQVEPQTDDEAGAGKAARPAARPVTGAEAKPAAKPAAASNKPAADDDYWAEDAGRVLRAATSDPHAEVEAAEAIDADDDEPDEQVVDDEPEPLSDEEKALARRALRRQEQREKGVLYAGAPSWKAYFWEYFYIGVGTMLVPLISLWIAGGVGAKTTSKVLAFVIPLGLGVLAMFGLTFFRNARRIRITTKNIETDYGIVTKKIDVLELWRCQDIRYRQSIWDRILRISYIDIYTADTEEPHLTLQGMPSSRQLFERIRDSIETQRERYGVSGPSS